MINSHGSFCTLCTPHWSVSAPHSMRYGIIDMLTIRSCTGPFDRVKTTFLSQSRCVLKTSLAGAYTIQYNTIQYNTIICNAHKVEYRTSNLRRGKRASSQFCQDGSSSICHEGPARTRLQQLATVDVAGTVYIVPFRDTVKLIGVTLEPPALTTDRHVAEVTRSCSYHARALLHIRHSTSPRW